MEKEQLLSNLEQAIATMNFDSVETFASEALKAYPEETFGYEYLAEALMKRESIPYAAVESCLIKLIQLDAHNTDAIFKYAELKKEQGEIEEAIKAYKNIVSQDQSHIKALTALGEYELYTNDFAEQALVYFDAAIANDPLNNDIRCSRAVALKNAGRTLDAMMELNTVMEDGFHENAYATKVEMMNEMQRFSDSIPLLEALVEHHVDNFTYQYHLGHNLTLLGTWSKAVPALAMALSLVETADAELLALYAEALMHDGQFDASNEAILKSITIAPDVFSYKVLQLRIKIAAQKYEEALPMAEALISKADETFLLELQSQKGFILAGMNRYEEALAMFNKMMEASGTKSYASYGLGYLAFLHEKDMAKAFFYMNNARIMGHADAEAFIQSNLSSHLKVTEERILAENTAAFADNAANELLKPLFNHLWHFEDISSEKLKDASEEALEKVRSQLRKRVLFFSKEGGFMTTANELKTYTYKIHTSHPKNIIDIELIPLNGLSPIVVRLNQVSKGFVFLQDEGEYLLFQKRELNTLETELKLHLQQVINKEAINFLGSAVEPLKNIL